jgi:hypothetical protein
MDLLREQIYAGLANLPSEIGEVDFGSGICLRRTYAYLTAPFLMAFSPAPPNGSHPAPWAAVKGGLSLDITYELHVPESFSPPNFFDRLNTAWWITSLLRLTISPRVHVAVITNKPFKDVPDDWKNADLIPLEAFTHRYHGKLYHTENVSDEVAWVVSHWRNSQALMNNARFSDTYQALDSIWVTPSASLALLTLWGALENLFSPAKQELRFRVCANIASYLEPYGPERLDLQKRLLKLYDARSSAAHGAPKGLEGALEETQQVARRVVRRMLEHRHVPTKEELDALLLG